MTSSAIQLAPLPPPIAGGPLQISIRDEWSFLATLPAPNPELEIELVEWAEDVLSPFGETRVYPQGHLIWRAVSIFTPRRRRGWIRRALEMSFAEPTGPMEEYWPAPDVARYFEECWFEDWAELLARMRATAPSPAPPLALPPAPVSPIAPSTEIEPGVRGLIQMAAEMGLDPDELRERLESDRYAYEVTLLVRYEGLKKIANGDYGSYRIESEYFFNKAAAEHNVANVNEPGRLKVRKTKTKKPAGSK